MTVKSAGILVYRLDSKLEIFLGHMGGPFWAKKDNGAWTLPKGIVEEGESLKLAAIRECSEEVGLNVKEDELVDLGLVKLKSGKEVYIFASKVPNDLEVTFKSNTFELEWPKNSGIINQYPEIDKATWFSYDEARVKITPGQIPFLDRLNELVSID